MCCGTLLPQLSTRATCIPWADDDVTGLDDDVTAPAYAVDPSIDAGVGAPTGGSWGSLSTHVGVPLGESDCVTATAGGCVGKSAAPGSLVDFSVTLLHGTAV